MNSLLFQKTLEKSKSTKELFRGRLNPISNREIEFKKINDNIYQIQMENLLKYYILKII